MHLICQTLSKHKIFSRGKLDSRVELHRLDSSLTYDVFLVNSPLDSRAVNAIIPYVREPHGREGNSDKHTYTHVLHNVLIKSTEIHCFISLFSPLDLAGFRSH